MSHFPGTDRYSNPELNWDKSLLDKLASGNLKALIGFDEAEFDETGNIELRCWACAAGALGERKPDVVSMDPSWHHDYASLGWIDAQEGEHAAHYPSIKPELVELRRRCTASPTRPTSAPRTWPTPAPMPTGSSCPPTSARR